MKNPRHKKPRHKNPWNTRRHPRQDPPWQDWGQVTDYKESLIGKVSGDTFYQTSESMSVASLELTFTIIRQVLLHFMIILLQYVFFNFKVWELYIRGNFPAPIET